MKSLTIESALDVFKILAENQYSPIWRLIEDFTVNGHIVRVKTSRQLYQVIIDDCYEHIGGNIVISYEHIDYSPLQWVEYILSK